MNNLNVYHSMCIIVHDRLRLRSPQQHEQAPLQSHGMIMSRSGTEKPFRQGLVAVTVLQRQTNPACIRIPTSAVDSSQCNQLSTCCGGQEHLAHGVQTEQCDTHNTSKGNAQHTKPLHHTRGRVFCDYKVSVITKQPTARNTHNRVQQDTTLCHTRAVRDTQMRPSC
jgi:hypothetical protein